jgi:predicted NUDIX family phosphoesterase
VIDESRVVGTDPPTRVRPSRRGRPAKPIILRVKGTTRAGWFPPDRRLQGPGKRWTMAVADERVMVVPAAELDRLGRFQGFSRDVERYLDALFAPGLPTFGPRSLVEDDPSLKQIIPYVVFRCEDSVFCYTRGGGGGAARLRRRRSLGVGGHVEERDTGGRGTLESYEIALRRELDEEVEIDSPGQLRRVGLINDDSTPVGQVHLGVVHLYELERPEVAPREADLIEAGFLPARRLREEWDLFETWSQICIDAILDPR